MRDADSLPTVDLPQDLKNHIHILLPTALCFAKLDILV
jgi:hypothetical protein